MIDLEKLAQEVIREIILELVKSVETKADESEESEKDGVGTARGE
jgi:hypothetical protein